MAYIYGAAIDQPLSIMRVGYSDITGPLDNTLRPRRVLPPFAIFPLWNSPGQAQAGAFADGGVNKCEMVGGYERCVKHVWPQGWFALARPRLAEVAWHGTLPEDKRDATGTHYRRNRYYDPTSGRFTQEDPIGLAGGLNLWGFADGDPVSYSDPYGLCPVAAASNLWGFLRRSPTASNCPKNAVGRALRLIESHGGSYGARVLRAIGDNRTTIDRRSCPRTPACTTPSGDRMSIRSGVNDTELAVMIFHEALHHVFKNDNAAIEESGIHQHTLDFYEAMPDATSPTLNQDAYVAKRSEMGREAYGAYICTRVSAQTGGACP